MKSCSSSRRWTRLLAFMFFLSASLENVVAITKYSKDGLQRASFMEDSGLGFRVELVHRDSTSGSLSRIKRLQRAVKRSKSRARFFAARQGNSTQASVQNAENGTSLASPSTLQLPVFPQEGEYMMELKIGTPPRSFNVMVDTGSDLVWLGCDPCNEHLGPTGLHAGLKRNQPFFPNESTTYQNFPCNSTGCSDFSSTANAPKCDETCKYKYEYADGSGSSGDVASETVTFQTIQGEEKKLPSFVFGCAHKLKGDWGYTQGLAGLGQSSYSLVKQLGPEFGFKFSYCLVNHDAAPNRTSPMFFGSTPTLRGPGIVTTPIVQGDGLDKTLYYVDLQGISIGSTRVTLSPKQNTSMAEVLGNKTVIDSGTTYTVLSPAVYKAVKNTLKKQVLIPIIDSNTTKMLNTGLSLCFNRSSHMDCEFPTVTLHYANNADVVLPFENSFQVINDDVVCLSMDSSGGDLSIIGNMQQQNFHIVYDVGNSTISFQRVRCDTL